MKQEMTCIDIASIIIELTTNPNSLIGSKILKIYQIDLNTIRIHLYLQSKKKVNLVIECGHRFHLSTFLKESPKIPTPFSMLLRKYLMGGRIESLEQQNFDRVIKIKIKRGLDIKYLIVELFSKGNILLLNEENTIIFSFKSSTNNQFRSENKYIYLSKKQNPLIIKQEDFILLIIKLQKENINNEFIFADILNLGKLYTKELFYNSMIIESKIYSIFEIKRLYLCLIKMLEPIINKKIYPQIILNDKFITIKNENLKIEDIDKDNVLDIVQIPLNIYAQKLKINIDTLSNGLDFIFNKNVITNKLTNLNTTNIKDNVSSENVYIRRLKKQRELIVDFEAKIQENSYKANFIYANYLNIQNIIDKINTLLLNYSWNKILNLLNEEKKINNITDAILIQSINPQNSELQIKIQNQLLKINILKTIPQNASYYYNISKKYYKKKSGAQKAIEETLNLINKNETKNVKKNKYTLKYKKLWYNKFRWFMSSDNALIIGGRDADTNEEIFKKYIEKKDIIFHTIDPGSPLVVIKSYGKEIKEQTIKEASIFCVSYSNSWKKKLASSDCYSINATQISKTPESGESLKKGSFIIRGTKQNYENIKLELAIGIELKEHTRVIGGPINAIKKITSIYYLINTGKYNQNDTSKKLYKLFQNNIKDKKFLKQIASPDKISSFLPNGESDIILDF